jgi:hypothetical protein
VIVNMHGRTTIKILFRKFYFLLRDISVGSGFNILFGHCMTLQYTGHYVVEINPLAMYFENNVSTW